MSNLQEVKTKRVTIDLGGEERVIKFDMNAFAELENKYGSIDAALSILEKGRMTDVRQMLWTGLIHDQAVIDPETGDVAKYLITPHQVGSWIESMSMLQDISAKLAEALVGDMPTIDEEELKVMKEEHEAKN